tara:strand:- start:73 stop:558 length:486 start_codon:yes stop_codon:yes gene_type:complete
MTDEQLPAELDQPLSTALQTQFDALHNVGLHQKTREAIEAMAYEGLPLPYAAERHDIRPDNLAKAFNKPHVRKAYNQVVKAIRDNAAQAAYMRINHLSLTSKSEQVKLKANEWVAGVDGISKVQKVQGQHHHSHSFGGFDYPDLEAKDITPQDNQSGGDDG